MVGPYTSYGAESDDSASLPLAGMQYTITADDGTWKIAKAQAFSEADHGADTEQILAEGGEFSRSLLREEEHHGHCGQNE